MCPGPVSSFLFFCWHTHKRRLPTSWAANRTREGLRGPPTAGGKQQFNDVDLRTRAVQ